MNSKEQVRKIISAIEEEHKMSMQEISKGMGYGPNYISDSLTPTGKVSDRFIKKLEEYQNKLKQKAPDVPDVDAFMATEIIKIEATLAVIVEILAEQEAARMNVPVTKLLSAFDKAIEDKEQLMRKQKR